MLAVVLARGGWDAGHSCSCRWHKGKWRQQVALSREDIMVWQVCGVGLQQEQILGGFAQEEALHAVLQLSCNTSISLNVRIY